MSFVEYYSTLRRFQTVSLDGMSGLYLLWKSANYSIEQGAIEYDHVLVPPGVSDQHVFEYYTKTLVDYPFGLKYRLFANPLGWIVEEGGFGYSCFSHKGCLGFSGQGKMLGPSSFVFLAHNVELFSQEDLTPETRNALVVVDELNQRLFCRHKEQLGRLPFLHGKVLQVLFMPMKYARGLTILGSHQTKKEYVYSDAYVDADVIVIRYTVNLDKLLSAIENAQDRCVESAYFLELVEPLRKHTQPYFTELELAVARDSTQKKEVGVFHAELDYHYSDIPGSIRIEAHNLAKARRAIAKACRGSGNKTGIPGQEGDWRYQKHAESRSEGFRK